MDTLNPTGLPQVMDEIVSGSVTRTYAYGLQRISENQLIGGIWTPSFYGYDGHGNVRFLTNLAGTVTDTYQYDAFGNQVASTGTTPNSYLYSGERFDSSLGFCDIRACYLRSSTGRFWSRDSEEGDTDTPLSFNAYTYAWQDPTDRSDATGLSPVAAPVEEPPTLPPGGVIGGSDEGGKSVCSAEVDKSGWRVDLDNLNGHNLRQ